LRQPFLQNVTKHSLISVARGAMNAVHASQQCVACVVVSGQMRLQHTAEMCVTGITCITGIRVSAVRMPVMHVMLQVRSTLRCIERCVGHPHTYLMYTVGASLVDICSSLFSSHDGGDGRGDL
jgi:hypothetical protein